MWSVAQQVEEIAKERDYHALFSPKRSDEGGDRWISLDLIDVIIHLFSEEARTFYDLDALWSDAEQVAWAREEDDA
jgi:ribosome-associated protein